MYWFNDRHTVTAHSCRAVEVRAVEGGRLVPLSDKGDPAADDDELAIDSLSFDVVSAFADPGVLDTLEGVPGDVVADEGPDCDCGEPCEPAEEGEAAA